MSDTPLLHEEKSDLVDLYKQSMGSGNYGMPTDYEAREEEDARLTLRSAIRALQRRAEKAEARVKDLEKDVAYLREDLDEASVELYGKGNK